MKTLLAFLCVFLFTTLGDASDKYALEGAWMEVGVKWVNAPPDVNAHQQRTQAAILFFGKDQDFGLIYCTVGREPNWMTISNGDGRGVYNGEWKTSGKTISITYWLVEQTVLPVGKKLPGPILSGIIKVKGESTLSFEGKTFRREPALDEKAREAIYGIQPKVFPKFRPPPNS